MEDARNREIAKQNQIKERREKIIEAERERREELLKRNMVSENFFGFDIKVEELHQSFSSFHCPQIWITELVIFLERQEIEFDIDKWPFVSLAFAFVISLKLV